MDEQEDALTVVKIAISGHRRFSGKEQLRVAIRKVLREIIQANPGKEMWFYSPLAEGADQLAASTALEFPEIKLVVPLPLSQEEYFEDFLSEGGEQAFHTLSGKANKIIELPAIRDHRQAYQRLGEYLVRECDVLVALWDGEDGSDSGGTGEVVEKARASGRKVYWIYCKNGIKGEKKGKKVGEIEVLN